MNTMERTERYDPEDLEHLMLERGFDELLEEERAYALRHLEGRGEYERMRALLHHVREEKRGHQDANPAVRERVLQAFREQQRPQWRIWLNSVGGFLFPQRPALYWRPALALGTVAVLVFAGLMAWNNGGPEEHKVLAEVRPEQPAAPAPAAKNEIAPEAVGEEANIPPVADAANPEKAAAPERNMVSRARTEQLEEPVGLPPVTLDTPSPSALAGQQPRVDKAGDTAAIPEAMAEAKAEAIVVDARENNAKRAERAETVTGYASTDLDRAPKAAPAYREDDLLGLLRAAW